MTVREYFQKYLEGKGMWPTDAALVMDIVIADKISEDVKWEFEKDDYPDKILAVLMVTVDLDALNWIKENQPEAWNRSMFE